MHLISRNCIQKLGHCDLQALPTLTDALFCKQLIQAGNMASTSVLSSNAVLASVVLLATVCACTATSPYAAGLSEDFYHTSCPQAASIVDAYVTKFLKKDRNFAGAFNRLQFHDCWVGVRNLDTQTFVYEQDLDLISVQEVDVNIMGKFNNIVVGQYYPTH